MKLKKGFFLKIKQRLMDSKQLNLFVSAIILSSVFNCLSEGVIKELTKSNIAEAQQAEETFGAEANPTRDTIGGGAGYIRLITRKHYRVDTRKELLDALKKAQFGQTIYIDDSAVIDLTGYKNIVIPAGVTLASGRGKIGSQGALLFSDELDTYPLFSAGGIKVRITGIRLQGPDPERRTEQMKELYDKGLYYSIPNSQGIRSSYAWLEVDNCELSGWSHAAIFLLDNSYSYIHHNSIHHNQRWGLGYGICLARANALIEANLFDWCRHSIAATGEPGTSYEARYNLVLENASQYSFDMHGVLNPNDGTYTAGDWVNIHHNTFRVLDVPCSILLDGKPKQKSPIHHNWFVHSEDERNAVWQIDTPGNLDVFRNQYTENKIVKD
ncbi:MAG: right-handed parallel beta-helix repeat-containing protein [Candidatus Jettenia sp. CY-1]|nr:right-handed parallel beta-helix repeat-containing protein [Candidatus Jettenia sp.]WKZ19206.1 MAG: right-handed parallel beta-helix repeat-containing protein [Candidatus Jettenia sp. CY-1]